MRESKHKQNSKSENAVIQKSASAQILRNQKAKQHKTQSVAIWANWGSQSCNLNLPRSVRPVAHADAEQSKTHKVKTTTKDKSNDKVGKRTTKKQKQNKKANNHKQQNNNKANNFRKQSKQLQKNFVIYVGNMGGVAQLKYFAGWGEQLLRYTECAVAAFILFFVLRVSSS